jgi:4-hydroxyphenylpyruvate dioxygenase
VYYHGPGVQHIAMASDNIIDTVGMLRARGVEFLRVPNTYYWDLEERCGKIDEPIDQLANLGILVDGDDEGYMLQIFHEASTGSSYVVFLDHPAQGKPQLW